MKRFIIELICVTGLIFIETVVFRFIVNSLILYDVGMEIGFNFSLGCILLVNIFRQDNERGFRKYLEDCQRRGKL